MDKPRRALHKPGMGLDFLREAGWLNAGRVRGYLWLLALLNTATLVFLLATAHRGVDRNGFLLGTDFLSFWTAGRMLRAGGEVYDIAAHIAAQQAYFTQDSAFTAFFYPPSFLPFCYPLGFLGYFPALGLWLLATGAFYLFAVTRWLRETPGPIPVSVPAAVLFAAFPPVLITVTHGQTAFLVAGLLGLGALLVRRAPLAAGALLGLATIKPQFGLLVPIVLVLTGEWRVIGAAAASALLLAAIATLAFGAGHWAEWAAISGEAQRAMNQGAVGYAKMTSPFAAAMLLGAPAGLAYALQALVSLGVAGAIALASWRRAYGPALAAAMLAGAPLVTPFVLDYDMVLLAFPLIWLAGQGFRPWEKAALALAFIAPAFARPLAMNAAIPIMPLALILLFAVLLRRAAGQANDMAEQTTRESLT
ncbi:glycosyltransferase family 87 protein [Novosphingobium sp. H3SJ31-1]|uniref:Glycosyltransferase family 87 protein n=1 Tax=Novosphingobium album (ex Liu et al. 2023) TaxID=3031130 RepID=A0ABT5WN65_9SPHN|nr:glycosyltransferase family 87 protein [Novosphingobium album (ex Liu et al. 2023)]